jgi:hypothetical protein
MARIAGGFGLYRLEALVYLQTRSARLETGCRKIQV